MTRSWSAIGERATYLVIMVAATVGCTYVHQRASGLQSRMDAEAESLREFLAQLDGECGVDRPHLEQLAEAANRQRAFPGLRLALVETSAGPTLRFSRQPVDAVAVPR